MHTTDYLVDHKAASIEGDSISGDYTNLLMYSADFQLLPLQKELQEAQNENMSCLICLRVGWHYSLTLYLECSLVHRLKTNTSWTLPKGMWELLQRTTRTNFLCVHWQYLFNKRYHFQNKKKHTGFRKSLSTYICTRSSLTLSAN